MIPDDSYINDCVHRLLAARGWDETERELRDIVADLATPPPAAPLVLAPEEREALEYLAAYERPTLRHRVRMVSEHDSRMLRAVDALDRLLAASPSHSIAPAMPADLPCTRCEGDGEVSHGTCAVPDCELLAGGAVADHMVSVLSRHHNECHRCTNGTLCDTGAELRLLMVEANEGTDLDGSDVPSATIAQCWMELRSRAQPGWAHTAPAERDVAPATPPAAVGLTTLDKLALQWLRKEVEPGCGVEGIDREAMKLRARDVLDRLLSQPATPPAGEPMLLMVPPKAGAVVRAAMKWREWARELERTAPEDEDCELIAAVDAYLAGRDPEECP